MKPRITVLTLAVADLGRSVAFYQDGLGFPTEGIVGTEFEHGAVAFFDLDSRLGCHCLQTRAHGIQRLLTGWLFMTCLVYTGCVRRSLQ